MELRVLTLGILESKWHPNQNGFAFRLLTQMQVRCLNYQHGWKNAPQEYQFNVFWMLQSWSVSDRDRKTRGRFLLHRLEVFAVSSAPFLWSRHHLSSQARRPGAEGWKRDSDVAGDNRLPWGPLWWWVREGQWEPEGFAFLH